MNSQKSARFDPLDREKTAKMVVDFFLEKFQLAQRETSMDLTRHINSLPKNGKVAHSAPSSNRPDESRHGEEDFEVHQQMLKQAVASMHGEFVNPRKNGAAWAVL